MAECVIGQPSDGRSCYPRAERKRMAHWFHRPQWLTADDATIQREAAALCHDDVTLCSRRKHHALQVWARYRTKPRVPQHPKHWLSNTDMANVLAPFFRLKPGTALRVWLDGETAFETGSFMRQHDVHASLEPSPTTVATRAIGHVVFDNNHWMAVWQDLDRQTYFFFDSECKHKLVPRSVRRGMRRAKRAGYTVSLNQKKIQHGQGECGMFVVYFLLTCLTQSPQAIDRLPVSDADMREFRRYVFASNHNPPQRRGKVPKAARIVS